MTVPKTPDIVRTSHQDLERMLSDSELLKSYTFTDLFNIQKSQRTFHKVPELVVCSVNISLYTNICTFKVLK